MIFKGGFLIKIILIPVALLLWPPFAGARPTESDFAGRVNAVDQYFQEAREAGVFNGNVLVAQADKILLHEAYGLADFDLGTALKTDHIFRIGSLSKPLTASAIMLAVERGLLSFEDPLCKYLANCPEEWSAVSLHHLLTHSSGVPDLFGDLESVPVGDTAAELDRVMATGSEHPLASDPGQKYSYSNFNYILLGYVLEKASGALWEDFLKAEVLAPLGISDTRYDDVYAVIPGRVRGYKHTEAGVRNIEYDDHAAYAAGGLLSTTMDLFVWTRALLGRKIVGSETLVKAFRPYVGNYGYGWQVREFFDRAFYNHTGGIDGFSSHIAYYPDSELMVIVLSSFQNDSAILRACDATSLLFDWRPPPAAFAGWEGLEPRQRCGLES